VLFLVWLAFLIELLVGVPATPSFLAWAVRSQLWLPLHDLGLKKEADEVLGYLILCTILLTLVIWGAVPVFALSRMGGNRARIATYAAFGGITAVFVAVSVRTMYLTWNWALLFDAAADGSRLTGWSNFITRTLCVLLCFCCGSVVLYLFYTAKFGTPTFIKQMLDDTAYLLCPTKMRIRMLLDKSSGESMRKSVDA
jgi:hypothetical protein